MKKYFEKHETLIAISLIIIYLVLNLYCINNYGLTNYKSFIYNTILSLIIIIFILKNKLQEYYGLTKIKNSKDFLYFIPLVLIISVNLWNGINITNTIPEIIFYILTMINVAFLEEIIFRGFLFKMMAKENIKHAIIVTTITFGIGHIINLLNGSNLIPTLMQIGYATATGFLFAIILIHGKSLWPCIITHAMINTLSIFNNTENILYLYIIPIFLIIIPILYSIYIIKKAGAK